MGVKEKLWHAALHFIGVMCRKMHLDDLKTGTSARHKLSLHGYIRFFETGP